MHPVDDRCGRSVDLREELGLYPLRGPGVFLAGDPVQVFGPSDARRRQSPRADLPVMPAEEALDLPVVARPQPLLVLGEKMVAPRWAR